MKIVFRNNGAKLEASYSQLSTRFDTESGIPWTLVDQESVPCVTPELLKDLQHHLNEIEQSQGWMLVGWSTARYPLLGHGFAHPRRVQPGGQLALFRQLIRNGDSHALLQYATKCIDVIMPRINHFNAPRDDYPGPGRCAGRWS